MKRTIFIAAASLALAGCMDGLESSVRAAAKQADFIGNPETIQLRDLAKGDVDSVCGDIKFQRHDGTWTSWRPFIHFQGLMLRTPGAGDPVSNLHDRLCAEGKH